MEEAIPRLNNVNLTLRNALSLISEITDVLTDYHNAGGDFNKLSLYSLINNKYYFKILKEDLQESTDKELAEEIEEDSNSDGGSEGNSGFNSSTNSGLYIENGSSDGGSDNRSDYSYLNKFLLLIISLYSSIVEFILEH